MATPHNNPAPKATIAHNLRVILVGRTGLAALGLGSCRPCRRLDTHIELARVRSPLEAVGELSEDIEGQSARVVIVSADADPALASIDGQPPNPERAREFIAALKVVDPTVRVLRLEGADGEAPVRAGYDGVIGTEADAEVLRAMIAGNGNGNGAAAVTKPALGKPAPTDGAAVKPVNGIGVKPVAPVAPEIPPLSVLPASTIVLPEVPPQPRPTPPPPAVETSAKPTAAAPVQATTPPATPAPAERVKSVSDARADQRPGAPEPMGASMSEAGDEVLVKLLLQGRDITDAALGILRQRLPGADLVFTTAGNTGRERGRDDEEKGDGREVSVAWRGRQFGRLRSSNLGLEVLAPHAAWLGSWMALRDQHAQLRDAAFTDPLTGAYNRRFFDHFLSVTIEQAREERRSMTVLMFDIDDFKIYNDRYGHAAGDEILTEAVRLLRSVIRPSDKVCRIGGDEFVVIFHEPQGPRSPSSKHPSDIAEIAERFQKEVSGHKFPKLGREAPGTLTISGGLATYPWDGATPESLLERADQLAFQSKRQGKNCITLGPGAEREHGANVAGGAEPQA